MNLGIDTTEKDWVEGLDNSKDLAELKVFVECWKPYIIALKRMEQEGMLNK